MTATLFAGKIVSPAMNGKFVDSSNNSILILGLNREVRLSDFCFSARLTTSLTSTRRFPIDSLVFFVASLCLLPLASAVVEPVARRLAVAVAVGVAHADVAVTRLIISVHHHKH